MLSVSFNLFRCYTKFTSRNIVSFREASVRRHSSQYFHIDDNLFGFTDEDRLLRKSIFDFAQKELAPKAAEIDRTDNFDDFRDFWKKLGSLGALGITVERKYGGTQGTYLQNVIITEELSRASGSVGFSYLVHSNLVANQIKLWGTEEQKEKYLTKICSGEIIGALAMSEPMAGSDVASMKLTATKDGKDYILNGSKIWITNGFIADLIIVYAKTDPTAGSHGISAFLVEKSYEGYSVPRKLDKLGMRGSDTGELFFDNVRVPESNMLGEYNKGIYVCFKGLDIERVLLAAGALGLMQAACDVAFEYVHTRQQFGKAVADFQLMQGKIADMYVALCSSKSFLYNVAKRLDQSIIDPCETAAAFLLTGENCVNMCRNAMQCLGGNGYTSDYPTGRLFRDSKVYEIGGGTTEIRRMVIGRAINAIYNNNNNKNQ